MPTINLGPCDCCKPDCCTAFGNSSFPASIAISFSADASDIPAGFEAGVAAILGEAGYTLTPGFASGGHYQYPFRTLCQPLPGVPLNDCDHPCVGATRASVFENSGNSRPGGFLSISCAGRTYSENGVTKQGARIQVDREKSLIGNLNGLNFEKYYSQPNWSSLCNTQDASYVKWRVTIFGTSLGEQKAQAELPYKYDDGEGSFIPDELYIDFSEDDCDAGILLPTLEVTVNGGVSSTTLLPEPFSAGLPIKITAQFNVLP